MTKVRKIWRFLRDIAAEWQENQVSLLASSLAYSTVFSLAPLLVIVILILASIFGEATANAQIVEQLQSTVGEQGAGVIAGAIVNLRQQTTGTSWSFWLNLGLLLFGATSVFAQIQSALNTIWEVKPKPGRSLFNFLRKRLLSFAMILVVAFLLLVSFVASTTLAALVGYLNGLVPGLGFLWQALSIVISFLVISLVFGAIYTILPDAEVAWKNTIVGSMLTTILFLVGQTLFGLFLRQTNFGSAYGIAGSFLIIIAWIYYAANMLFLGAEFTKVYGQYRGQPIVPAEYAVSATPENDPPPQSFPRRTRRFPTKF